jgi:alcohol dehydrogenase class IV
MDTYQIMLPDKIRFGVGCIDTLGNEAKELATKRALIITDPGVYQAGLADRVKEQLSGVRLSVDVCAEAEPEPTFTRLNALAEKFRTSKYGLLVGVGGGSSLDTTKALSILLAYNGNGQDYVGVDKIPGYGIPVFALPTTAGTGSEITQNAIFGDQEKQLKMGMVSIYLIPRLALVDPSLTYGCPTKVTAASGLDALIHAVECYTGNKANTFSDTIALKAMELIAGNLRQVVKNGSDKEARNGMAEGSLLAGITLANAGTAAVHALAYPLGARFHIPHGIANGVLFPYVTEFNLSANVPKYAVVARMLGVETDGLSPREAAEKSAEAIKALAKDIGIPLHLRELGVPREALEGMAVATMDVTRLLANNPKPLTLDDVRQIWQNAW